MAWSSSHNFRLSASLHQGALVANYPFDSCDTQVGAVQDTQVGAAQDTQVGAAQDTQVGAAQDTQVGAAQDRRQITTPPSQSTGFTSGMC
jgi:hypothetical protein